MIVGGVCVYRLAIHAFPERGPFVIGHGVEEGFAECGVWVRPPLRVVVGVWAVLVWWPGTGVMATPTFMLFAGAVVFLGGRF